MNERRIGWLKKQPGSHTPVEIITSTSGCDETIIPLVGHIEARRGRLSDSEIVIFDPHEVKILEVGERVGGMQKISVKFPEGVVENLYVPVPMGT